MTQPENNPASQVPAKPEAKPAVYDKKDQHDRIVGYIIPGERLVVVYDLKGVGTGFVGITDRRVIFYDQGTLFNKKKTMISIPYHQVIAIASSDEGVIFQTSEVILITAAGRFTFDFRGPDKAHWAYRYIMNQILTQAHPQLAG